MKRHLDWIRQADYDIEHAKVSLKAGHYEWACFAAQQSAEMAVKAVFESLGMGTRGHSVSSLLLKLPEKLHPDNALIDSSKILDRHYVPARYPNGLTEGSPRDAFTRTDAEEAVAIAERTIRFCRRHLSDLP